MPTQIECDARISLKRGTHAYMKLETKNSSTFLGISLFWGGGCLQYQGLILTPFLKEEYCNEYEAYITIV